MKIQRLNTRLVQGLVLLLAIGFFSAAEAQRLNFNLKVEMQGETSLEVTTKGKCGSKNHYGCIEVEKNRQARLKFSMSEKTCTLPGGQTWRLGEVYLGGKGSSDKPGSWGGLDAEVEADFDVADAATGLLNRGPGSNRNTLVIMDYNNSRTGYDIWYKLTAVCVNESGEIVGTIETDPRIKNGGTQ